MEEKKPQPRSPADYDIVFAHVRDLRHVELVETATEVSRQAENIRLLMDAIERVENPRIVTFTTL